jgi:hypothetical protein
MLCDVLRLYQPILNRIIFCLLLHRQLIVYLKYAMRGQKDTLQLKEIFLGSVEFEFAAVDMPLKIESNDFTAE